MSLKHTPVSQAERILHEDRLRKRFQRLLKRKALEGPASEECFTEPAIPLPEK